MSNRAPSSHQNDHEDWPNGTPDPLWDLLGRARPVTPSPYFTRRVLRAVRNRTEPADSLWSVLLRWRTLVMGSAVAAIALFLGVTLTQETGTPDFLLTNSKDLEVIAHLHELLNDDTLVWQNTF